MSKLISKFKFIKYTSNTKSLSEKDKNFLMFLMRIKILPLSYDTWDLDCKRFLELYERNKK